MKEHEYVEARSDEETEKDDYQLILENLKTECARISEFRLFASEAKQ